MRDIQSLQINFKERFYDFSNLKLGVRVTEVY